MDCYLVFRVVPILVKVPFGNMQVCTDSLEIIMDLLHVARLAFLKWRDFVSKAKHGTRFGGTFVQRLPGQSE